MNTIVEFLTRDLRGYPLWLNVIMIVIIVLLTQVFKLPIKHFTNKIADKKKRDKINAVIVVIPIALAVAAEFVLALAFGYKFTDAVLVWGGGASLVYEVASRLFKRAKKGEEITLDVVKSDIDEASAEVKKSIDEAVSTLSDGESSAEKEFEELVDKIKKQ